MIFRRKTSGTVQQLLDLLREQQAAQAAAQRDTVAQMSKLVDAATAQTQMVQGWLKLFTDAPKPEVRVMNDYDEVLREAQRRRDTLAANPPVQPMVSADVSELNSWITDMAQQITLETRG